MAKHFVFSDVHEDHASLEKALYIAQNISNLDDIWFLGDVIGHRLDGYADDAFIHCLEILKDIKGDKRFVKSRKRKPVLKPLRGNWEYWLFDPKHDEDKKRIEWKHNLRKMRSSLNQKSNQYF